MKKFALTIAIACLASAPSLAQDCGSKAAQDQCTKSKAKVVAVKGDECSQNAQDCCPDKAAKKAATVAKKASGCCPEQAAQKVAQSCEATQGDCTGVKKASGCCAEKAPKAKPAAGKTECGTSCGTTKARPVSTIKGIGSTPCGGTSEPCGEKKVEKKVEKKKAKAQIVSISKIEKSCEAKQKGCSGGATTSDCGGQESDG